MTIYIIQVFLIFIISTGLHPTISQKRKKRFLILAFALLTIVSGVRGYSVGADTRVYVRWFENIDFIAVTNGRFEAGFILFLKVVHKISNNPSFLLLVSSSICIGTFCVFTGKFSKQPTISILLYILLGAYFSQMNVMRQALAMSISMWAFMLTLQKKKNDEYHKTDKSKWFRIVISALLIVLAASFHTIAIVTFVPWVLVVRQKANEDESRLSVRYAVIRTFFLALIVFAGYSTIMRIANVIIPKYSGYFSGTWSDSNYFASLISTLINLVFLSVGAYILRGRNLNYEQRFSVIMLGMSIIFQVLSIRMEIWGRIAGLFNIYVYLIWIPEIISAIKLKTNKLIVETGVIGFSFLYMLIVLIFRPEWTKVVPYVFK